MSDQDVPRRASRGSRIASAAVWMAAIGWGVATALLRPRLTFVLPALSLVAVALLWTSRRGAKKGALGALVRLVWTSQPAGRKASIAAITALVVLAVLRPHEDDVGPGRLFRDQTYHHQALRALNDVAVHGADVSEVLETPKHVRAGDAQGWYAA
jgi:hypothetical protein